MKKPLAVLISLAPVTAGIAAAPNDATPPPASAPAAAAENLTPENILATQVTEIAAAPSLSHETKAKRIGSVVQIAIDAASADTKDLAQILKIALELSAVAAKIAPDFTAAIVTAALSVPAVAGIDGAAGQIQAAVEAAAKSTVAPETATAQPTAASASANPEFGGKLSNESAILVSPSH